MIAKCCCNGQCVPDETHAERKFSFRLSRWCFLWLTTASLVLSGLSVSSRQISTAALVSLGSPPSIGVRTRKKHKLNVLSLGGSITWGSMLRSRESAYPFLLKRAHPDAINHIDNIAVRAADSFLASICLQSMVKEAQNWSSVKERRNQTLTAASFAKDENWPQYDYDLITIEYSVNGFNNFDVLLRRIRARYPEAFIVYIDLYSNRIPGVTNSVGDENRIRLKDYIESLGGLWLELARPSDPLQWKTDVGPLFASDEHHLNEKGHELVGRKIIEKTFDDDSWEGWFENKDNGGGQGNWHGGDSCYDFFTKDIRRLKKLDVQVQGAKFVRFEAQKFSYEVSAQTTARFNVQHSSGAEPPIFLMFMAKIGVATGFYPITSVVVNDVLPPVTLDPFYLRVGVNFHVVKISYIGRAAPASKWSSSNNTITVSPLEKDKTWPFRVTGVALCEACLFFGMNVLDNMQTVSGFQVPTIVELPGARINV